MKMIKPQRDKTFRLGKKGLGVGQVFVFIVAAITFAFIMIFGYRAITGFLQSGEDVAFVQFKTSLESSVKRLYTEFGSVRVETFTLPAIYRQICFVDLDAESADKGLCDFDLVACTVWESVQNIPAGTTKYNAADENVFLTPPAPAKIKVGRIQIDSEDGKNYLCFPIKQGSFTAVLEGKGDRTGLSRVPSSS